MTHIQHEYVEINGIRMHYATAGQGPLLLLLHGFPEFWYSWHRQIEHFSPYFKVVAPDLRGYNDTDKPDWGYEPDVLIADMIELIKSLGYQHALVAGHDWGGLIAWGMAILYPHRVTRLVVLNTPHPALLMRSWKTEWNLRLKNLAFTFFQIPWLPEIVLAANDYAMIEWMLRGVMVQKEALSDKEIDVYKDAISKPGALSAILNWYRFSRSLETLFHGHPVAGLFKDRPMQVQSPTLLLWGQKDHDADAPLTYNTEQYVPDLHIVYVPGCSHRLLHEKPQLVNRFMAEFLAL